MALRQSGAGKGEYYEELEKNDGTDRCSLPDNESFRRLRKR